MRRPGPPELDDLELLLVDGDNLLHAVRGGRDAAAVAWLLPRLVAWRPPALRIVVTLDGHPAPGASSRGRVTRGIEFRHAGSRSADDLIIELLATRPFADRARTAVVSRDRGLQARARRAGGMTRSTDWLVRQLGGPAPAVPPSTTSGPARIARPQPSTAGPGRARSTAEEKPDETDREGWRPGRGATRKKGNPRRAAKRTPRR